MKKRLISLGVCLSMLMPCISAYAAEDVNYTYYTPGATEQVLISNQTVLQKDTEISFNTVLDFDAKYMTVRYTAQSDVTLTVKTDRGENTAVLKGEATEAQVLLKPELRFGKNTITLCATDDITINSIKFNKVDYYPVSKKLKEVVKYTPYEKAMEDVVVVASDNSVIKVNGALRYVDYDKTDSRSKLLDGKIYLPVKAFANAFSLYSEDYNDYKNYVHLSDDNFVLYCSSHNGSYCIRNGKKETIKNPVVYVNSVAYLPVRYVAELMGKTVDYREGFAVIGESHNVENVMNNQSFFTKLSDEMGPFSLPEGTYKKMTYYVSQKTGNDGNAGTKEAPFATISKAAQKAYSGDTVIIMEGIYRETVTPKYDGKPNEPIIYKAAEGAEVVISAMDTISGFEQYNNNIYCAEIPKSLGVGRNFVTINDDAVIEGRHPNSDTHKIAKLYETNDSDFQRKLYPTVGDLIVTVRDKTNNRFTLESQSDLIQAENFWKGATVVAMQSSGWTLSTGEVIESSQGKIVVKDINPSVYGFTKYDKATFETDFGYITNHLNTVDSYGEWYVDGDENKIYMIPPKNVEGKNLEIELKQRQTLIDLSGKSYIQFKGINTFGGGITMKDSTMCVINGGEHKYISHFTQNTSPHSGNLGTSDTDPAGPQTKGEVGEYISGKNNAFVNATIDGSAGPGIYTAGAYSYIENNTVLNTDYAGIYPSGITIEGERWNSRNIVRGGHTVIYNTVKYAGRGCLYNSLNDRQISQGTTSVFPTVANDIGYNEFGRGCLVSRDGGVVYEHGIAAGNDEKQSRLHHNVVYDNVMQRAAEDYTLFAGIYRDAHTVFEQCYSNIYFNTDKDPDFAGKIDSSNAIYNYNQSTGPAYTENYNNLFLGYKNYEQDGLSVNDYPGGRMFSAGAKRENRFLYNIEETSLEKTVLAEDFVPGNGASVEDGMIKIQNAGDSFVVDDVNSNSGAKHIKLSFTGDKYDFGIYCFDLDVIKDGNIIYTDSAYISGGGSGLDDICESVFYIPEAVNTGNKLQLRLMAKDKNPIKFQKLVIDSYNGEIPEPKFPKGSKIIAAGTGKCDSHSGNVPLEFKRYVNQTDEFRNSSISKICNTTLSYTVETDEINAIQVMMATGSNDSNGTLSVYADNDATPLCVINLNEEYQKLYPGKTAWLRIDTRAEFDRPVSSGKHIFKLVFSKNTSGSFTPDFYNLALYNTKNQ